MAPPSREAGSADRANLDSSFNVMSWTPAKRPSTSIRQAAAMTPPDAAIAIAGCRRGTRSDRTERQQGLHDVRVQPSATLPPRGIEPCRTRKTVPAFTFRQFVPRKWVTPPWTTGSLSRSKAELSVAVHQRRVKRVQHNLFCPARQKWAIAESGRDRRLGSRRPTDTICRVRPTSAKRPSLRAVWYSLKRFLPLGCPLVIQQQPRTLERKLGRRNRPAE
jgi:hypothetical protein